MQEVEVKEQASPLVPVQNALTEFDKVSAGLIDLTRKYANVVYPVASTKGMEEAKAARLDIRNVRYSVQRVEKAASDELNSIKKNVKERAEQIITVIEPLESAIDKQIKAEEDRKAEEKRRKEEAETARVAAIRTRIAEITISPVNASGLAAADIKLMLDSIAAIAIDESFAEFLPEAATAKEKAVSTLLTMHAKAVATEEMQAQLKAEREELARQQAEIERQRKELEEARSKAEAARVADEQARAEAFRRQEDARLAAEAEAARIANKVQEDAFALEREQASKEEAEAAATRRADLRSIAGEYKQITSIDIEAQETDPSIVTVNTEEMSIEPIEMEMPGNPTGVDIVMAVADYYGVSMDIAWQWISAIDAAEVDQAIAEAA